MAGSSGRGPTIAISPLSTLMSCGSSSSLTARSHAPSGNTRGSCAPVIRLASERRRECMVRSLYMMNGRPPRPTRSALYSTGPGLARRMPTAASASSGAATTSATPASSVSTRRLTVMERAPDGHVDFGRIEALLVAPRPGAVAQRLERSGVWVWSHFTLVARHRRHLLLERGRDIDPRVGGEAPGVRPLGTRRRVERIHGLDARLGRARRHEDRLEQNLVIAVHVPPVLAVDDFRLHLAHHAFEGRDDLGQRH